MNLSTVSRCKNCRNRRTHLHPDTKWCLDCRIQNAHYQGYSSRSDWDWRKQNALAAGAPVPECAPTEHDRTYFGGDTWEAFMHGWNACHLACERGTSAMPIAPVWRLYEYKDLDLRKSVYRYEEDEKRQVWVTMLAPIEERLGPFATPRIAEAEVTFWWFEQTCPEDENALLYWRNQAAWEQMKWEAYQKSLPDECDVCYV